MRKIICFCLLTVIQIGYSQIGLSDKKNQKTGLSDEEFVQLKKDYGEMTRSATYLAMKMRMAEFASKLNGSTPNIESQEEWDKWISENLSKTAFKTIDEGKLMFKSGLYLTTKNHEEYPNVYSQLNKATRKQSLEISKTEAGAEFFKTPSISTQLPRELSKADYEKAKTLYLKMLDSPNWKKSDSISKFFASRYADAYKFIGNSDNIPDLNSDSLYIPWIKENLHLTKFTSLDEVLFLRNEWKKANVEVNKENLPLYDLMGKASTEQFRAIIQPFIDRNKPRFLRN